MARTRCRRKSVTGTWEFLGKQRRKNGDLAWQKAFADTLARVLPKAGDPRLRSAERERSDTYRAGAKDIPKRQLVDEEKASPIVDPPTGKKQDQLQIHADKGDDNVGAVRRLGFSPAGYHGTFDTIDKSRGPVNGQDALDTSVPLGGHSRRRIGIDYDSGEFVVFDYTEEGTYHGHIRSWDQLRADMQNTLRKAGMTDKRGKIRGKKDENGG